MTSLTPSRSVPARFALLVAFAPACGTCEEAAPEAPAVAAEEEEPLEPLVVPTGLDERKIALGRRLFFDPTLSGDGTISCASCHTLEHGGAEPDRVSTGIRGQLGNLNAPTVLNSALNFVQFWDGRAADLRAQAEGPVENPVEGGARWEEVVAKVAGLPHYATAFAALYPDGVTKANITDAIAVYEESLATPSPFDAYLGGDEGAITDAQRRGHETFERVGCPSCHNGQGIGGGIYQKMGLLRPYFGAVDTDVAEWDMGRFNVTHTEAERHFFKVPMLRNTAITGPYLHDGSQAELEDVVRLMGRHQLDTELTDAQVRDIAAFLGALTGELPANARPTAEETPPAASSSSPSTTPASSRH